MQNTEQLIATQKANVETAFVLANMAFDGMEKVVRLNVQATKWALCEAATHVQAVLSVKNAQAFAAIQSDLLQPLAEKATAYNRQVYDIVSATNADVAKVLETQLADLQAHFLATVDTAFQNGPAGSGNAVALLKASIAAANSAYESVYKATTQAADTMRGESSAVTPEIAVDAEEQPA